MHDNLLGYLLGALDSEETAHVEQSLMSDEAIGCRLALLRRALQPLECAPEPTSPPEGLAERTCQRIREARQSPFQSG